MIEPTKPRLHVEPALRYNRESAIICGMDLEDR